MIRPEAIEPRKRATKSQPIGQAMVPAERKRSAGTARR